MRRRWIATAVAAAALGAATVAGAAGDGHSWCCAPPDTVAGHDWIGSTPDEDDWNSSTPDGHPWSNGTTDGHPWHN
jgi:hypothetical protein